MTTRLRPSLLALASGFICASILVVFFSPSPLQSLISFFTAPFSSTYFFGSMLNTTALLLFGGIGASLALISGNFNLGGEGQIYVGGLVTALILSKLDFSFAPLIAVAAVIFVCGFLTLISILLKIYQNSNELLTSFLISASCIPLLDWAIANPLRDQSQNLLSTPAIFEKFRLSQLLSPSPFTISFFIAITLCIIMYAVLFKTKEGELFRISGKASEFSLYAGLKTKTYSIVAMTLSGSFHGLTGFFAVVGMHYTCHQGFYVGMGWNALTVALIAHRNPLALIPSALFLSYIFTASDYAVLTNNFSFNMTFIIQAAVLFVISATKLGRLNYERRH